MRTSWNTKLGVSFILVSFKTQNFYSNQLFTLQAHIFFVLFSIFLDSALTFLYTSSPQPATLFFQIQASGKHDILNSAYPKAYMFFGNSCWLFKTLSTYFCNLAPKCSLTMMLMYCYFRNSTFGYTKFSCWIILCGSLFELL